MDILNDKYEDKLVKLYVLWWAEEHKVMFEIIKIGKSNDIIE